MILKLINNENTYEFNVTDLNEGVKLYYHFEIPTVDIPDGKYNMQLLDGETVIYEDIVCIGDFKGATIQYKRGENIYINAPLVGKFEDVTVEITATQTTVYPNDGFDGMTSVVIDATPVYDDGFNSGSVDGYNTGKQDGIEIGYNSGYTDGETTGYNNGYQAGIDYVSDNANELAAANAIVLDVTEYKTYYTKYVDIPTPEFITGEYPDGENFYNYAILRNISYDTGMLSDNDTKIELWWCGDVTQYDNAIIGWQGNGNFKVCVVNNTNLTNSLNAEINYKGVQKQNLESNVWYHIELSKQEGFKINGELIGTFESAGDVKSSPIYLNTLDGRNFANGKYGMVKINDTIIIPTPNGFLNTNTNEMLSVAYTADSVKYIYENQDIIPINNLIKQVNVNAKIDVAKYDIKFSYSNFSEIPDFLDFSNVTDMGRMFSDCGRLTTITQLDTSNVTNMSYMFSYCSSLTTIPQMDTSNVTDMSSYFRGGGNNLINVGGWINLNCNWNDNYSLARCSNLSYQSCINILNGLADVTELGGRTLKVHSNFLTTVGNEISIATSKNWTITA